MSRFEWLRPGEYRRQDEPTVLLAITKIRAKAEGAETLAEVLAELAARVAGRQSSACGYHCGRSTDDRNLFLFLGRFPSEEAFRDRTVSGVFAELAGSIQGLVDGAIEIETYEDLAGKD